MREASPGGDNSHCCGGISCYAVDVESSALTKSDLDEILKACEEIGTVLNMKMSQAVDRDGQLFQEKLDDFSSRIGRRNF